MEHAHLAAFDFGDSHSVNLLTPNTPVVPIIDGYANKDEEWKCIDIDVSHTVPESSVTPLKF